MVHEKLLFSQSDFFQDRFANGQDGRLPTSSPSCSPSSSAGCTAPPFSPRAPRAPFAICSPTSELLTVRD